MTHPEATLQAAIVTILQLYRFFPVMIPNGEINHPSPQRYQRLVAQGFRRGAPDLFVFDLDNPTRAPLHLEVKTPKGKQSPGQKTWQEFSQKTGWTYRVARTECEALEAARDWRKNARS